MIVCEACGGSNISKAVWVDCNDGSVIEGFSDDVRCWDCDANTGAIDAYKYELLHPKHDDSAADGL